MYAGPTTSPRAPRADAQFVERNQRGRILAAVAADASESGYAAMTVESIIGRAGVAAHLLRALQEQARGLPRGLRRGGGAARAAGGDRRGHGGGISGPHRGGLGALLAFLASTPRSRGCASSKAWPPGPRRSTAGARACAPSPRWSINTPASCSNESVPLLDGRDDRRRHLRGRLHAVLRGETARLPELLPDLVYSALLPYLGQSRRRSEERRRMLDERSRRLAFVAPARPSGAWSTDHVFLLRIRPLPSIVLWLQCGSFPDK